MSDLTNPLKIGVVCYPTRGGSGVVAVELAHRMADRGHRVFVVSYAQPPKLNILHENISFHPVRVPDYPLFEYPPYSLALAAQLSEVISNHKLDLVHVHYALPHALSAWMARKIAGREDLPIITTLHGTDITIVGNDPSYLNVTRYSVEVSTSVTAVSNWLSKRVNEVVDCECDTKVIYNFIDTEKFAPGETEMTRKLREVQNSPVLIHLSNFRPVKRIDDVIEIFFRVRSKMPVRLLMIGDGPDRSAAEAKVNASPWKNDVHFLGDHDAAEEVLPGGDLMLFPTDSESFGLAALEAMACGVPVIGAKAGGLPEVVEDGISGRLFQVGDVEGMANAALEILSDRTTLATMSAAARKTAVDKFKADVIVQQYEHLYRTSIEKARQEMNARNSTAIDNTVIH